MHASKGFILRNINCAYYILPVGQKIAEHNKSIKINETGAFLWNNLQNEISFSDLLQKLSKEYQLTSDEIPSAKKDLTDFISSLKTMQMISSNNDTQHYINKYFKIAGIHIGYSGPEDFIHKSLFDFETEKSDISQHWIITLNKHVENFLGELIIRNDDLEVFRCSNSYILRFPSFNYVKECQLSLNGSTAELFCFPEDTRLVNHITEEIFQSLRICFFYIAQIHNLFAVHSSSILYKGKAWLFSAPSGTGKSTHTNMWADLYDTPLLNGDLNLCTIKNNKAEVLGIPWCGTSEIYTSADYSLGGIILLKRSSNNIVKAYRDDEKILHTAKRLISPTWTAEMFDLNLRFCSQLINIVDISTLYCNKDKVAVETIKKHIDSIID